MAYNKIIKEALTFDDVLICPASSGIEPREADITNNITKRISLKIPILGAAMDRVTESGMAIALAESGAMGVIHRNCDIEAQAKMVREVKNKKLIVGAACGPFDRDRAFALYEAAADVICFDCAHGHNKKVIESIKGIVKEMNRASLKPRKNSIRLMPQIIVGNVVTQEAARDLASVADAIKVGVGPGSICTTRIVSGVGMPQLTAILDVVSEAKKYGIPVIADGGIKNSGDMAKAFAAGASAVMLGNIFAGTDESPGKIIQKNGKKYKEYRGMGSKSVLDSRISDDRYLTKGRKAIPEGVEGLVPYKGSVKDVLNSLVSGVQVAMGYVGAQGLLEFSKRAKFVRISNASLRENSPHSLVEIYDSK